MKPLLLLFTIVSLALPARAPALTGTWQADGKPQRVLNVHKTAHGYTGDFHNLGDEAPGAPRNNAVSTIVLTGATVGFSLDKAQGTFDGTLSGDGKTIAGNWKTLYGGTQPLTFTHAAKGAEWA